MGLTHDSPHNLPRHIRQPKAPSLKPVSQPLVIDAEQVQQCSVEIVVVNAVFHDVVAELARLAMNHSRLHANVWF